MTIYKYPLPFGMPGIGDRITIPLSKGAQILSVVTQGFHPGSMVVYAIVDPAREETEEVVFTIRGTGQPMDGSEGDFLGTVSTGEYYWHIFYRR